MKTLKTEDEDVGLKACHEIQQQAELDAKTLAWRNLPMVHGDSFAPYLEGVHHQYQHLIESVNRRYNVNGIRMEATKATDNAHQETIALQNKIGEQHKYKNAKENELASHTPAARTKIGHKVLLLSIMAGICIIDSLFNRQSYEYVTGSSYLVSWAIVLVMGGVFAIAAHFFRVAINLGRSVWAKVAVGVCIFGFAFFCFWELALLRVETLTRDAQAEGISVHLDPTMIAVISCFIFLVAVAISYFGFPTREEMETRHKHDKITDEIKSIDTEILGLNDQILAVEKHKNEVHNDCANRLTAGQTEEAQIMAHARSCFSICKRINLMHRKDSQRPDCFDEAYPYDFTTNFQIKNLSN